MKHFESGTTESLAPDGPSRSNGDGDSGMLLVAGEGMFTHFPLVGDEVVIGRARECDVVIEHAALSRRHALLRLGPPLTLEDLGSKNGTRLARSLIEPGVATPLSLGESFHVGRFSFVVVRMPRSRSGSTRGSINEALHVLDPTAGRPNPLLRDIAKSGLSTLILGETGVGKEVLAETLHRLSERKGVMVRINCAAIAPALIESELFGHEKGAFTGAAHSRPGLLEAAAGGTVFLDEVGDLPAAAQAKLLRAIETREVVRVGAVRPLAVDVRFVAATNRDLAGEVASGQFRSDLFFRLDGVTLVIPPLRERRNQIGPLALQFLRAARERSGAADALRLAPEMMEQLERYAWPGNVRELKAVIERAVILARGGEIGRRHLAFATAAGDSPPPATQAEAGEVSWSPKEADERQRIIDALEACASNQTRAAKYLGISRATLVNKLGLYRIPRPRK